MALMELFLILAVLPIIAVAGVAVVLVIVWLSQRPGRRAHDPDAATSPLGRARDAASVLTAAEWEEFRRWVERQRHPPPSASEGITQ